MLYTWESSGIHECVHVHIACEKAVEQQPSHPGMTCCQSKQELWLSHAQKCVIVTIHIDKCGS